MEGALLTHSRGMWQRRRGHTEAGSWAAWIAARICGTLIVVLVASSWPAATGATAATPVPQKAPASGPASQPTPDPAPQASSTPKTPREPTTPRPSIRVPVVVAPARTSPRPVVASTPAATSTASTRPRLPASTPHTRTHRAPAAHRARPTATTFSFPLALPRDLLLIPDNALRVGAAAHRDGTLLLFSSLAMAAFALASLSLLRRLRRLELR
jgi:hypothetical protein